MHFRITISLTKGRNGTLPDRLYAVGNTQESRRVYLQLKKNKIKSQW